MSKTIEKSKIKIMKPKKLNNSMNSPGSNGTKIK